MSLAYMYMQFVAAYWLMNSDRKHAHIFIRVGLFALQKCGVA